MYIPRIAASSSIWNLSELNRLENLSVCHKSSLRPCPTVNNWNQIKSIKSLVFLDLIKSCLSLSLILIVSWQKGANLQRVLKTKESKTKSLLRSHSKFKLYTTINTDKKIAQIAMFARHKDIKIHEKQIHCRELRSSLSTDLLSNTPVEAHETIVAEKGTLIARYTETIDGFQTKFGKGERGGRFISANTRKYCFVSTGAWRATEQSDVLIYCLENLSRVSGQSVVVKRLSLCLGYFLARFFY